MANKVITFINQVKSEAAKVSWPQKSDLMSATAMVVGVVIVCSLFFLLVDFGINTLVQILLNIGK